MATACRSHKSPRRLAMIHEEATKLEKDTIKLEREAKDKEMKLASIRAALAIEHRLHEDISKEVKHKGWWGTAQKSKCSDLLGKSRTLKPLQELKSTRSASCCSLKTSTTENELMGRIKMEEQYELDSSKFDMSFKRASSMLLSSFDSDTSFDGTKLSQSSSSACFTDRETTPVNVGLTKEFSESSSMMEEDPCCMGSQTDHFCPPTLSNEASAHPPPNKNEKSYFEHLLAQTHMVPKRSLYESFQVPKQLDEAT